VVVGHLAYWIHLLGKLGKQIRVRVAVDPELLLVALVVLAVLV
jgi:uncharacterized membrane-anchored protein